MRVVFDEVGAVREAIYNAEVSGKSIRYIVLTEPEWSDFCRELSLDKSKLEHNYNGVRIKLDATVLRD